MITAVDGAGLPSVIELANMDEVTFVGKGSKILEYKIGRQAYEPHQIWHEKQYTMSGVPFGLSPIAHAAYSLNPSLSAMNFAADWFSNSTLPGGHLKNTSKVLKRRQALKVKSAFKESVTTGDVWVSGSDWEFNLVGAKASESQFLETIKASVTDICRFLGVPGDMIDAETSTGAITYANITQRNLQLLIMNINPAIVRRETSWSRRLLATPRYAKLNRAGLLAMDLKSRYEGYKLGVDGDWLEIDEVRDLENLPPIHLPNDRKVAKNADHLGALVRAGFEPIDAAKALGLDPIKHTGLVPITVVNPDAK